MLHSVEDNVIFWIVACVVFYVVEFSYGSRNIDLLLSKFGVLWVKLAW